MTMEEKVCFRSGDFELEGLFESGHTARGVVITHPHPLYGGDMHNPVVETIRRAYRMKGVATLRFNFRGTGESEGQHDNGVGEQDEVLAALSFLMESGIISYRDPNVYPVFILATTSVTSSSGSISC